MENMLKWLPSQNQLPGTMPHNDLSPDNFALILKKVNLFNRGHLSSWMVDLCERATSARVQTSRPNLNIPRNLFHIVLAINNNKKKCKIMKTQLFCSQIGQASHYTLLYTLYFLFLTTK